MQLIETKIRGGYLFQAKHLKLLATSALLLTCEFNQAYAVDVKKATESKTTANQEKPSTELEPVTVEADAPLKKTGSITTPDIETAKATLNKIAGGANVIDSKSYSEGRVSNLKDVLGYSPGVYIQPRFGSDEARLSIRGSGLQRTFHMRGINMLQDGIPVNLADGGGDFQGVDGLNYDYLEVYRGANALQYGGTTLGGAINFISPTGYTAPKLQMRMEGGSYGYLRGQAATAGVEGNTDYFLSYTHTEQDGFRDHARQKNHRFSGNVGIKLSDRLETRFFAGYTDTNSRLPGSLTSKELYETPRKSSPNNFTLDQQRNFQSWRMGNKTTYSFDDKNRLEVNAFYSYKDLNHPIFQVIDQLTHDYGGGVRFISENDLFGHKNQFVSGLLMQNGDTEDRRYTNQQGRPGLPGNSFNLNAFNLTAYMEDQFYLTDRWVAVLGGSWTQAERQLNDLKLASNSFDESYNRFTPKVGVRYEFTPTTQVFANYSQNFEPPSFGELSGGPLITKVKDQKGHTVEIGSRGRWDNLLTEWDAAFYHTWIDNEFLSLNDPTGLPLGTISADKTIHQGIELGLTHRFLDEHLVLRQNYMWNNFHFDGDRTYGNKMLAGVPEHFYRADLVYHWDEGFYLGPNVEWTPSDYAVDHANTLNAKGYALLGSKVGYANKKQGWDVFLEGRNLTDQTYTATTGVIADAKGRDSAQFMPGDGITVYGGFKWSM
jgi:iron complex outermembrane receptor protein